MVQVDMMDALISSFVSQKKERINSANCDETDATKTTEHIRMYKVLILIVFYYFKEDVILFLLLIVGSYSTENPICKLPNKLSKLTLATFDEEGSFLFLQVHHISQVDQTVYAFYVSQFICIHIALLFFIFCLHHNFLILS